MEIALSNIDKNFTNFRALDNINLNIASGELIALLGPSGSGKTTLLRVIAGLEFADGGTVHFGGQDMAGVPLQDRRIGFVFQHYALFKHMTVRDNISFGLRVKRRVQRPGADTIRKRAEELLELVQLSSLGDRYPHQLSGGQRQRVALARALMIEPRVLLLDEPFGALDAKVRKELRQWLRDLHRKTAVTTIFVTHDQEEALELADRVVIMESGRVAQAGTVDEVYERPASPFVFDFLGSTNILSAELVENKILIDGQLVATCVDGSHGDGQVDVYVRPGDLRISEPDAPGIDVEVLDVQRTGPIVRSTVTLQSSHRTMNVELPHLHHDVASFHPGKALRLRLMMFSLYAHQRLPEPETTLQAPRLIGRERERNV